MRKRIIVLLAVLLLAALTIQVAFADPDPPNIPPTGGACHMGASWWEPLPDGVPAPGNANGVQVADAVDPETGDVIAEDVQQRGMVMAHYAGYSDSYTNGASHMDQIVIAHCY